MKAVICDEPGKISYREVEDPVPGPNEVVIRVKEAGICDTDFKIFKGLFKGLFRANYPIIPGHEFCGEVAAIGSGVQQFKIGDAVTGDAHLYCGKCYYCRTNRQNHCVNMGCLGITKNGAFAEYLAVSCENVYRIDSLNYREGATVEPLACVVYGIKNINLSPGDEILIMGSGPIGLLTVQLVQNGGASKAVVTDLIEQRLKVAQVLGADATIKVDSNTEEKLKKIAPLGFDVVIEATGSAEAVERAFDYVKEEGKILVLGVHPEDAEIKVKPLQINRGDLTIRGSKAYRRTFDPAIKLLENRKINVEPIISWTLKLKEFQKAMKIFESPEKFTKLHVVP